MQQRPGLGVEVVCAALALPHLHIGAMQAGKAAVEGVLALRSWPSSISLHFHNFSPFLPR